MIVIEFYKVEGEFEMNFMERFKNVLVNWKNEHPKSMITLYICIALAVFCNVIGIFNNHNSFTQCLSGIGISFLVILAFFLIYFGTNGYIKNGSDDMPKDEFAQWVYIVSFVIGFAILVSLAMYMNFQSSKFISPNH